MPKNFRALTKLRKRELEQAERALREVNFRLEELMRERERLREDERLAVLPHSGDGVQVAGVLAQKRIAKMGQKAIEVRIENLLKLKKQRQQELKSANIAYEQAKSIESKVLEEILKKESRRLQSALDEMASQQFWRQKAAREDGD